MYDPAIHAPNAVVPATAGRTERNAGLEDVPLDPDGRFKLIRQIGSGGFGDVYEAWDSERGEAVALKRLRTQDPESILALKREFRVLAGVHHPALVRLHELFAFGDRCFFTMELVRGRSFANFVAGGAVPEASSASSSSESSSALTTDDFPTAPQPDAAKRAAELALGGRSATPSSYVIGITDERLRATLGQLAEGLHALHCAGKVHCDLKPGNVLVDDHDEVRVLDFGLAASAFELPVRDVVIGTRSYLAPERWRNEPHTPAADWYSFGALLFRVLTGAEPPSPLAAIALPPTTLAPWVPQDLDSLCLRLLQREPHERPRGEEIVAFFGGSPSAATVSQPSATAQAPFVGRAKERAELDAAFRAAREGRTAVVSVVGRSGIGKSELVRRFLADLRRDAEALIVEGRCHEQETIAWKAVDGVVDALSQALSKMEPSLVETCVPDDAHLLAATFPVLGSVQRFAQAGAVLSMDAPPHQVRRRTFAALRELLRRLGEKLPLLMVIDDLQWADEDSLSLLRELVQAPGAPRMMLLASYREEDEARPPLQRWTTDLGQSGVDARQVRLEALSEDETRQLWTAVAGPDPLDAARVFRETEGNPFFVTQLGHRAEHVEARGEVPSLEVLLRERTASLPDAAGRVLRALVLSDAPLSGELIAAALEVAPREVQDALTLLRDLSLVRTSGIGRGDQAECFHDRIRSAVQLELDGEELERVHLSLASAFRTLRPDDFDVISRHLRGGGLTAEAAKYARRAADVAMRQLAFDRAAERYREALEWGTHAREEERSLQLARAEALVNAGRLSESAPLYLAAAVDAPRDLALECHRLAAEQLLRSGHFDDGIDAMKRVLAQVDVELAPSSNRALMALLLRRAQLTVRGIEARDVGPEAHATMNFQRIDTCWAAATGLGLVDNVQGAHLQVRTLLMALDSGEPYRVARSLAMEAAFLCSTGGERAFARAARIGELASEWAGRTDNPHAKAWAAASQGIRAFCQGQWRRGKLFCEEAETILKSCTGVTFELVSMQQFALMAMVHLGELDALRERLPPLLRSAQERGDIYAQAMLRTAKTNIVWLADDDLERAEREIAIAAAQWSHRAFQLQHFYQLLSRGQADLYANRGAVALRRWDEAWRALGESHLMRIHVVRTGAYVTRARSALNAVLTDPKGDRQSLLGRALADLQTLERERLASARAVAIPLRAAWLALGGQREQAIDTFARAAEVLDGLDMPLDAAASRLRQGELEGGTAGAARVDAALAVFARERIKNPRALARILAVEVCS